MNDFTGVAHGKLIITGEHAVVHGCPALAMATQRRAVARATPRYDSRFSYYCTEFAESADLSLTELRALFNDALERHRRFLSGELAIDDVLPRKQDLVACAAAVLLDETVTTGFDLELEVDIPLGCGMGSSAAVATAVIRAVAAVQGRDLPNNEVYDAALLCEQLIHGRPSGVDVHIAVNGGWTRFQDGVAAPPPGVPPDVQVVNTGRPDSGTGECVDFVRSLNIADSLWVEFRLAAVAIEAAIINGDDDALICGVRTNHRLLCEIGVVPEQVQTFIAAVEEEGGAAKIAGAGSVRGDAAGVVLVFGDIVVDDLCADYGYEPL